MPTIEKHTPRGIDLADGGGYLAEGPRRKELQSRVGAIFDRIQAVYSYFPNLEIIGLSDKNGRVWRLDGFWNEERNKLQNISLSTRIGDSGPTVIQLNRESRAGSAPYIQYVSYSENLFESNSGLILSKAETVVDQLLNPFEQKIAPTT